MAGQHGLLLAVYLIKGHFGDIVSKVCGCLLRRGSLSLQEIGKDTGLAPQQVKNCLLVLIQHNCVQAFSVPRSAESGPDVRALTLYTAIFDNVIHRMRFSKFLAVVKDDLGTQCEILLEGLLQHGRLTFEQLIQRAVSLSESSIHRDAIDRDALPESFNRLVQAQYVERCPKPEPFLMNREKEAPKKRDKTALETVTLEMQALEAATLIDAERFSGIMNVDKNSVSEDTSSKPTYSLGEKRKLDALEMDRKTEASIVEKEVLWRANFEKFIYSLKKKACVSYKKASLCLDAGIVLEALIDSCNVKGNLVSSSLDSIFERLIANPQAHIMNKQHVRAILEELDCESSIEDLKATYTIDLKAIIKDCQIYEVESVVLKRYGKDAYRIFRLLATKNQAFETDKISDLTFVEKRGAQILLYKLWQDNILHMERMVSQELRKTYYLWKVNRNASWENFLDDMYHAAFNLYQRIAYNYEQDKEVADLPVNAMTSIQREKYKQYANRKKLLEGSLLKIDDVLMLFHDY